MTEITDTLQLNRIWLLLYGTFSGAFAFLLYELACLLADRLIPFILKMCRQSKKNNKNKT